jgi:hypothetical protein
VAGDDAYLRHVSEVRSTRFIYRDRIDFVARDVRYQRRFLTWVFQPAGVGLVLIGVFVFVGQLLGSTA